MTELPDEMYCSQQICIPPTFPYLLRQYAKAAIRSQPIDLLKWSTAYFRCLSLNIPPPVKPRLEYPIPKGHCNITPGWLRALLHQFGPSTHTVSFKVLWDRWIGACLLHENLIQILCLGAFTDNTAVPLWQFMALCVAFLTDSLTQTMCLVCEILTEEPEGGSAMITVEMFLNLYTFLAAIDASKPQMLKNLYFTDADLGLYEFDVAKPEQKVKKVKDTVAETISSESTSSMTKSDEVQIKKDDLGSIVSCPSIADDDDDDILLLSQPPPIEQYLMTLTADGEDHVTSVNEEIQSTGTQKFPDTTDDDKLPQESSSAEPLKTDEKSIESLKKADDEVDAGKLSRSAEHAASNIIEATESGDDQQQDDSKQLQDASDAAKPQFKNLASDGDLNEPASDNHKTVDGRSADDIQPLVDTDNPKTTSRDNEEGVEKNEATTTPAPTVTSTILDDSITETQSLMEFEKSSGAITVCDEGEDGDEFEDGAAYLLSLQPTVSDVAAAVDAIPPKGYEDVYVDAVPGIGGTVPDDLVKAVCDFMRNQSIDQHGMVMPRNIRHHNCPPLE